MSKTSELRELSLSGVLMPVALTDLALQRYFCSTRFHDDLRAGGIEEAMLQYYPLYNRMPMHRWSSCSIQASEIVETTKEIPWKLPAPDAQDGHPPRQWETYRVAAERTADVYVGYHKQTWTRCKLVRIDNTWFPNDVLLKLSMPDKYYRLEFSYSWQEVARYDIYFWVWSMNADPVPLGKEEIAALQLPVAS